MDFVQTNEIKHKPGTNVLQKPSPKVKLPKIIATQGRVDRRAQSSPRVPLAVIRARSAGDAASIRTSTEACTPTRLPSRQVRKRARQLACRLDLFSNTAYTVGMQG